MEKMEKLFNDLESLRPEESDQAKREIMEYFSSCKESWIASGLIDYFAHTNSIRVCEVLINAGVIQPHDTHIFNKLQMCLKDPSSLQKKTAIGLFIQIVRRHPTWLHKVVNHSFLKELLKLLKIERDVQILILGIHCLISLLPIIPQSITSFLNDMFEIFNHLALMTYHPSNMKECELVHLQYGLYMLFCRLYGMYPCNFVDYIKTQYNNSPIFNHTIRPLLETVKIHPNLVISTKNSETSNAQARFKKMEPHDVVVECTRYTVEVNYALSPIKPLEYPNLLTDLPHLPAPSYFASAKSTDGKIESLWRPSETPTTTPVQSNYQAEQPSPPQLIEAAIEATPETTPMKVDESGFRSFSNANSQTARKIFGSNPSSPKPPPGREFRNSPLNIVSNKSDNLQVNSGMDLSKNQKVMRILNDRHMHQAVEPMMISPEDQEVDEIIGPQQDDDDGTHSDETMDYEENSSTNDEDDDDTTLPLCNQQIYQCVEYVRRVKRLRMYSQCVYSAGTSPASNTSYMPRAKSSSRVKRYNSWPNLTPTDPVIDSTRLQTANGNGSHNVTPTNGRKDDIGRKHTVKSAENQKNKIFQEIRNDLKSKPFDIVEKVSKGTSTVECWPGLNLYSLFEDSETSRDVKRTNINDEVATNTPMTPHLNGHGSLLESKTSDMLDDYIKASLKKMNSNDNKDHLELLMIQLQFEKYRREIHAERNRRLLGKSRQIRGLEQSNATIADQNARLSAEIKNLNEKAAETRRLHQAELQKLKDDIRQLSRKCNDEIEAQRELTMNRDLLQLRYEDEQKLRRQLAQENECMKAELFDLKNLLAVASEEAQHGKECRQQLVKLESDMILFNESRLKWQNKLEELDSIKARDVEADMMYEKYSHEVTDVKRKFELLSSQNESYRSKINDLEQQLSKKEAAVREHKSSNAAIKRVYDEKIRVLEGKYSTLKSISMKMDEHMFELAKNQATAYSLESEKTADIVGCSSPLSISLASSDGFSASLRSISEIHRSNIQPIMENFAEQPTTVYPSNVPRSSHQSSHDDTS